MSNIVSNIVKSINYNKSIRDKEIKILKYYKRLSTHQPETKLEKPKRRTRKQLPILQENIKRSLFMIIKIKILYVMKNA